MQKYDLISEVMFSDSRSQGPGGQNVNKVNTRIELRFNIPESRLLTQEQKDLLLNKLSGRITKDGVLILSSQSERSQIRNKKMVIDKFNILITNSLQKKKPRIKTKPGKSAIEKRLEEKKIVGRKKEYRKKLF